MVRDLELAGGICARSELRGFNLFIDCRSDWHQRWRCDNHYGTIGPEPNAKFDSDQPSVVHLKGIFVLVTKVW